MEKLLALAEYTGKTRQNSPEPGIDVDGGRECDSDGFFERRPIHALSVRSVHRRQLAFGQIDKNLGLTVVISADKRLVATDLGRMRQYRVSTTCMGDRMEHSESKRPTLVGYAAIFGVEILPEEESLERSVDELIGFIADIDALDLDGVVPASIYDPAWPRVNEVRS